MSENAFTLRQPSVVTTSAIFASPHSGRAYPKAFLRDSMLDARAIRSSEDAFMDDLIEAATDFGATSILARYPRAYVDLNRSEQELDPAVIAGLRRAGPLNPRIASGLGVIPRVVSNGRAIYRGKIPLAEADSRLRQVWRPYHAKLGALIRDSHVHFGRAILVDCHSMPHEAIEAHMTGRGPRPDVVLGDRFGAAASPEIIEPIEAAFAAAGLNVARNSPFAGAYVSQRYGRPARGCHVVQIEVDRALYLDEARVEPSRNYKAFKQLLTGVIGEIADIGRPRIALAAE